MPELIPGLIISKATELTEELYQMCQRLVPQLTTNNPPPRREELELLISSNSSSLFLAKHPAFGDEIIGMATLILYRVPTGLRAYIEDVVVDERARNKRVGEALTQQCLEWAQEAGAPQAMLTCSPGRLAANKLYQRMGFELRKTNVYRYPLNRR
jgi:ribosomal protein S18 acetylase RimI-like enzyme